MRATYRRRGASKEPFLGYFEHDVGGYPPGADERQVKRPALGLQGGKQQNENDRQQEADYDCQRRAQAVLQKILVELDTMLAHGDILILML